MLTEYANVAQKEKGIFRRWFQDDYFDLIIWYDLSGRAVRGFQLCYDKGRHQHAFTWHRDSGFAHNRVDESRTPMNHPATPILVSDGIFPADALITIFRERSANLNQKIIELVMDKISEYGSSADHG